MESMRVTQGWAADTTRPLGVLPIVFAAISAAVIATVFSYTPVLPQVAWTVFALLVLVLALRGIRWISRQLEAARVERQMAEILERQPRLVPLFRPPHDALAHDAETFHKAS